MMGEATGKEDTIIVCVKLLANKNEVLSGDNMNREELERYAEHFNKFEGQPYPCSNQIVVCAVMTRDRDKALSVMNEKGAVITRQYSSRIDGYIEWELNNERWLWKNWNMNQRGLRFYKVLVDENIDDELLRYLTIHSAIYCCSMEII